MRSVWLLLAIAALGCGRREHAPGGAGSAQDADATDGGALEPGEGDRARVPGADSPRPEPTEELTLSAALVTRLTTEGPRAALRPNRGKLLAATAEVVRELGRLLPQPARSGIRVEPQGDGILVRGLPKSARLELVAQAPHARIKELFHPLRTDALRSSGSVQYFVQGNGTLRADDGEERARDLLGKWLGRIPPAPDVRYVYRDFCLEGSGRHDLGIDVVRTPAVLAGPVVKRVRLVVEHTPSVDTSTLVTEFVPGSGQALLALVQGIAESNQLVLLVWADRVLWRTWSAALNPDPDAPFSAHSLGLRAQAQDCPSPTLEQIAERVRVAALLEEAREPPARDH
jgi:hypothetical protein